MTSTNFSHLLLALFMLLTPIMLFPGCSALLIRELSVPRYAELGVPVNMSCVYELGTGKLYSVKWYKDGNEFCRFMPAYSSQLFPVDGIVMDVSGCQEMRVTLKTVNFDTSGTYRCEVSTESPNFETVYDEEKVIVRAVPKPNQPPIIRGLKDAYEPGEWVVATCTARRSHPAATLQWYLNGDPVKEPVQVTGTLTRSQSDDEEEHDDWTMDDEEDIDLHKKESPPPRENELLISRATIRFQARPEQFVVSKHFLELRCEALVHELSWRATQRIALAGPGGKQHLLSQVELDHNRAGIVIASPSLLLVPLLRTIVLLLQKLIQS